MTSRSSVFRRRGVAAAALTVSLLLTTACNSGEPPPENAPASELSSPPATPTSVAAPPPSPTPSYKPADASGRAQNVPVPVLPEAAKAETKEGAIAFASHWFSLLSYGYETGDLAPLNNVTTTTCGPCAKAMKVINAWHEGGRWLIGGQISTPAIETTFSTDSNESYKVVVQARQTPLTYVRADGTIARTDPQADDTGNLLFISYRNSAWHLNDVGNIVG